MTAIDFIKRDGDRVRIAIEPYVDLSKDGKLITKIVAKIENYGCRICHAWGKGDALEEAYRLMEEDLNNNYEICDICGRPVRKKGRCYFNHGNPDRFYKEGEYVE